VSDGVAVTRARRRPGSAASCSAGPRPPIGCAPISPACALWAWRRAGCCVCAAS